MDILILIERVYWWWAGLLSRPIRETSILGRVSGAEGVGDISGII